MTAVDTTTLPTIPNATRPNAKLIAIGPSPAYSPYTVPLGDLDTRVDIAITLAGARVEESWADLSAIIGTSGASAIIPDQAGTHTDPITAATVDNAGLYRYKIGIPAGWKRISDTASVSAAAAASSSIALAYAWAEGTLPGGSGTKSAKEHATDASGSAIAAGDYASDAADEKAIATAQAAIATAKAAEIAGLLVSAPAAGALSGTSTTSLTIGAGSRSLTTQTGKAWVPGQFITIARTSDAANQKMFGSVTAYNSGTGAMTVDVDEPIGSGTYTDWTIGLSGPKRSDGDLSIAGGTISGGARTTVPIDFLAPVGSQTNSLGNSDAINYSFITSTNGFTQGPTGHANYFDNVMSWAGNANGNLTTRTIAEMPIFRIAMESKFAQGGATDPFLTEWHLASLLPTGAGGEFRGISVVIPHDSTKWETHSVVYLRGSQIQLAAGVLGTDIYGQFDTRSSTARFVDWSGTSNGVNFRHRFNKNGNAVLQQMNAAGNAWLNLPFYNANDAIDMGGVGTIIANGAAKTSSITSLTGMLHMNASGMAASGTMQYMVSSTAITGNLTAAYFQFNVSGYGENVTINAGAGAAGHRIRTSAGRQFLEFHDNTGNRHIGLTYYPTGNGSLALDNAQQGGQFANKTSFTVDYATFQCQFGYAPKLPSSLVASLPAAATAGAGALQYVTNLNATTAGSVAAGGGSNKGVVVCDGTDWRIMTAW